MGEDRGLLSSLALTAGRLWRTQQLAEQARRAEELGRIDELRASLLAAVGHDLRNPLAAITAAATTLRQTDIQLDPRTRPSCWRRSRPTPDGSTTSSATCST